jgi:hypothetical protein
MKAAGGGSIFDISPISGITSQYCVHSTLPGSPVSAVAGVAAGSGKPCCDPLVNCWCRHGEPARKSPWARAGKTCKFRKACSDGARAPAFRKKPEIFRNCAV